MRMNIPMEVRALLAEMASLLSAQIGHECPACGAKDDLEHGRLLVHENDCAIIRARYLLGKEVA